MFSHKISELLLGQMEAVLHGEDVSFICRRCVLSFFLPATQTLLTRAILSQDGAVVKATE